MTEEDRQKMGAQGRQHVLDNYGFELYSKNWKEAFQNLFDTHGSWETRKNYKNWSLIEL